MFANSTRRWPVLTFALLFVTAATADWRQLVLELSKPDVAGRVYARQLLPREGVKALPSVLPLLANDDQGIRLTARNVVADILNEAAAPGHEADQLEAARLMMTCVTPDKPEVEVLLGLRLLPIVVPDGFDVSPVAALLQNPGLREKARECLQSMATDNACRALIDAIPQAEPTFAVALIDAAGKLQRPETVDALKAYLANDDPGVRAAAAMALSWTGDPALAPLIQDVASKATPETQFEAYDALLYLTDGIAARGGNWDLAMGIYRSILASAPSSPTRAAAVMGLGRYGDASAVEAIVTAGKSGNGHLDDTIVQALTSLKGRESVKAVMAAYPSFSETSRAGLLSVWGQEHQLAAVDLMKQELSGGSPKLRAAALHALADTQSPDAFAPLVEVAQNGSDDEKTFALAAVKGMAGSLDRAGDAKAAGEAYIKLYHLASDDTLRLMCLQGIARCPVPPAYDLIKSALENPALKDAAIEALASVAGSLAAAGDKAKATEALNLVRTVNTSPEMLIRLAKSLQGADVPADFANLLGVVKVWRVVGPFDWKTDADWDTAFVGEPDIDLHATYKAGDATLAWKPVTTPDPLGAVDLASAVAQRDRCFAYAYSEVEVPEDTDAQVRIGSDDGNKVWVNGKVIWENRVDRGMALDQDTANVRLVKGRNRILVKISQGAGGWNFCLRLALPAGAGVQFTQLEPGS